MWDDFAAIPGRIKDGTTADPACDHVQRLDADLDLLSWLGVDAYRFSISWPRVTPQVDGTAISVIAREPGSIGTRIGDVVRVKPRRHYIFDANNAGLRPSE